jgi:hypothetical protein
MTSFTSYKRNPKVQTNSLTKWEKITVPNQRLYQVFRLQNKIWNFTFAG